MNMQKAAFFALMQKVKDINVKRHDLWNFAEAQMKFNIDGDECLVEIIVKRKA